MKFAGGIVQMLADMWMLLIPLVGFAVIVASRRWSHWTIGKLYVGVLAILAVWAATQGGPLKGTVVFTVWYAAGLALIWLGFWLWRGPPGILRAGLRVVAAAIWVGTPVLMAWSVLPVACIGGDCI